MHSPADLSALLAAIAERDRVAFARLYDLTAPKLLGLAARIVRDRATAEEVVQEVFLRVWQSAGSFSPESGRPMTWLATIARNRAIDVVRRSREVPPPAMPDGRDWLETVAAPGDPEHRMAELDRLRFCLGRLDEVQRRCLLEAYLEGQSREELAQRFGKPVNTIKTWLHRSALAVRACMDEP